MNRLTLIIFILLFVVIGYVTYLAKLALEESRSSRQQLKELALKLAQESSKKSEAPLDPVLWQFVGKKLAAVEKMTLGQVADAQIYRVVLSLVSQARLEMEEPLSQRQLVQSFLYLMQAETLLEGSLGSQTRQPAPAPRPGTYRVGKGETLWSISKKLYRTPWYWNDIWKLNASRLPFYKRMPSGMLLKLPI